MRKRLRKMMMLALLIAAAAMFPTKAQAQFGGGTGDWWDPYIIATTDHWLELADSVNSGINYHEKEFLLTADLDFAGIDFVPIGGKDVNNNDSYFAGKFDGCNHSILNVQVGVSWYAGLFGNIWDATVKNLTLGGNSWIEGLYYVGGIVGRASYGLIDNCHVEKTVTIAASKNSSACFGGIAGGIENRTVLFSCTNVGTVTSNRNYYVRYVGGIAGYVANDLPAIRYCINYGAVDGHRYVGGVVGNYEKDYELKGCLTGAYCTLFAVGQSDSSQGINLPEQANSMHTITFGENVHYYISPWARVNHFEGKDYYKAGSQIAFNLYPDSGAPDGYLPLFDVNGVQHRPGDSIKITMPAEDVTITVSGTLRDIAYGPWVSVSLSQESFEYNGSVQVPAVTVTDTQNETPVTLTEGTDYEVILPSNSIYPGTYTIVINGLGDFGGTVETQYSITSPFGNWIGEGTEESPYLIFTTDDMHRLAQRVSVDPYPTYLCEGEFFSLQNDLDYSGKDYSPIGIGYSSRCFNGTFNGNGHALINVVIQGNGDYQALFGHIGKSGVVSGLTLGEGSSIEGRSYVGGIVAWCEDGTVSDCSTAEGVTIRANTWDCAGGIVSRFTGGDPFDNIPSTGRIANCLNRANVSSNGVYCGGIVGQQSDDGIIVTRCVNEGNVSGSRLVGGIVGDFCKGEVEHCLNLGAVSASGNSYVGGIAGKSDGRVYNNYYAGACSVGGIGAENSATGADATNAQRGYAASGENGITLGLENTVRGLAHNGLIYAETNRTILISITPPEGYAPLNGYTVSAGSLTSHKSYWELRMPAEDVVIRGMLVLELLDDDSQSQPDNITRLSNSYDGTNYVRLQGRTLYRDGRWNTLCLPFSLASLAGTPLEGATVKQLVSSNYNASTGTLTLNFATVSAIEAGKPYIVRWPSDANLTDVTSPVFESVTVSGNAVSFVKTDYVDFIGCYSPVSLAAQDRKLLYMGGDSKLYYPSVEVPVNAFRGYFQLKNGLTAGDLPNSAKNFVLNFGDETTGINQVDSGQLRVDSYYSIDGRKLNGEPVQKGVYVRNGRKVVVK